MYLPTQSPWNLPVAQQPLLNYPQSQHTPSCHPRNLDQYCNSTYSLPFSTHCINIQKALISRSSKTHTVQASQQAKRAAGYTEVTACSAVLICTHYTHLAGCSRRRRRDVCNARSGEYDCYAPDSSKYKATEYQDTAAKNTGNSVSKDTSEGSS